VIGEVRIVDDVPASFAELAAAAVRSSGSYPFILGCSGGASGAACFRALASEYLDWGALELVFVDERCVPTDSPEYNAGAIAKALGDRFDEVAGFHPMSCDEGPGVYAELLESFGRIDLVQLGLGPDGHTASIFPNSRELLHPSETLVATNVDPTGRNVHDRLTMTLRGLALAKTTVVTVVGADKHDAFTELQAGRPLPGALVDGPSTIWLVDAAAARDRR
jgi:6-phosphogluconolactonase/glucosamine-6-phosphate isomerase/deaminase